MNKCKISNNYQFTGDFMYSKITNAANSAWQELAAEKTMDQAGYVYIYTATESDTNVDIYFDDFDIRVVQTHIVAGNDYYPFGLPIVERSYERQDYRYDYQGQFAEKDDETGYNAFQLRMYDARIGRFISPDPMGQFWSAYVAMGNNPIFIIDPDGGTGTPVWDDALGGYLMDELVVFGSITETMLESTVRSAFSAVGRVIDNSSLEHTMTYPDKTGESSISSLSDIAFQTPVPAHFDLSESINLNDMHEKMLRMDKYYRMEYGLGDAALPDLSIESIIIGNKVFSSSLKFLGPVLRSIRAAKTGATGFNALVKQLPKVGQQNVRTLQNWAKSKGFVKGPNTGGPQVWGVYDDAGNFSWRLKIKAQGSTRSGLEAGSQVPRFDARLGPGNYVNPFTGQKGGKAIGTHLPLY